MASDTRALVKFGQGSQVFHFGVADSANVLAEYVGGEASMLSGLMTGADNLRTRPFAVDIPKAHDGHGRVIMFANNPVYRWQNHGEFNMIFNAIVNWDDATPAKAAGMSVSAEQTGSVGRPYGYRSTHTFRACELAPTPAGAGRETPSRAGQPSEQ